MGDSRVTVEGTEMLMYCINGFEIHNSRPRCAIRQRAVHSTFGLRVHGRMFQVAEHRLRTQWDEPNFQRTKTDITSFASLPQSNRQEISRGGAQKKVTSII